MKTLREQQKKKTGRTRRTASFISLSLFILCIDFYFIDFFGGVVDVFGPGILEFIFRDPVFLLSYHKKRTIAQFSGFLIFFPDKSGPGNCFWKIFPPPKPSKESHDRHLVMRLSWHLCLNFS